ncbi:DUF1835 domain-containing protein [Desulfosporosinus acidiphilus]|uniref:DUF1835 domain-containing protein n=1 Tax=Desulfosporosinus acidiphilus TaxID=885581 RepID=UPI000257B1DB|nr:DUF1835 domain-containing protein [Desulfosporosinus acidiphilus]
MGESLRIWYSNHPDEMCGLYWFMGQLNQWKAHGQRVSIVKLPEGEADEKGNIVQKSRWGQVTPGEWHRYLAMQKPVIPVFVQSCASHWQELQRENTPLRATLNGQLISVPETLYDDFIFREIAAVCLALERKADELFATLRLVTHSPATWIERVEPR